MNQNGNKTTNNSPAVSELNYTNPVNGADVTINRDENGMFTSGEKGSESKTYGLSKKEMDDFITKNYGQEVQEAVSKLDEATRNEMLKEINKELDKSFAEILGIKENEIKAQSVDEALASCNPNYLLGRKYQINCQRCVQAFELSMRGFPTEARESTRQTWINDFSIFGCENEHSDRNWISEHGGYVARFGDMPTTSLEDQKNFIERKMLEFGDGARGTVALFTSRSGHVFNVVNEGGNIRFVDPQSNNRDCSRYFGKDSRFKNFPLAYFIRTDDLPLYDEIDGERLKRVVKKKVDTQ